MIVVDLICSAEHRFEGWFASQEAFERQNADGMVSCPTCGVAHIRRLPSAPHLARPSVPAPTSVPAPSQAEVLQKLLMVLQKTAEQSEDVGKRFPEEARRIHYGDAEERAIRGTASQREALDLLDEGISVLPLPQAKEDLH